MAFLYPVRGPIQEVHPKDGEVFSLEELQAFVGGWIEHVGLEDGRSMWINEEGKLEGLPWNIAASLLADLPGDVIVGPALVATNAETGDEDEEEGEV